MRSLIAQPRLTAILSAAGTFSAGFVVLSALSATGRWEVGRSMWDYRAATWGNGVAAPAISATLAAAIVCSRLPPSRTDRLLATVGGALAALAASLVQLSWLAADDPVVNWTLPGPHRFSTPGWYNAAYLVVISAACGAAALVAASRVRRADEAARDAVAVSRASALLSGMAIALGVLLAFDSADSVTTSAGAGSVVGAFAVVLALVLVAVWVFGSARGLGVILRGLPLAVLVVALSVATHGWPTT